MQTLMNILCFSSLALFATLATAQEAQPEGPTEEAANVVSEIIGASGLGAVTSERTLGLAPVSTNLFVLGVPYRTRLVYCVLRSDGHQIRVGRVPDLSSNHIILQSTGNACELIRASRNTEWGFHTAWRPGGATQTNFVVLEVIPGLEWMMQAGGTTVAVRREPCGAESSCLP